MLIRRHIRKSDEDVCPRSLQREIRCRVCGQHRQSLGWQHTQMHGMTPKAYKAKFGVDYLFSEYLRWKISQSNRPPNRPGYEPHTRAQILDAIRACARIESPVTYESLETRHPGLGRQAVYAFRSWKAALRAAGINQPMRIDWSPALVLKEVRRRRALGQPLNPAAVRHQNSALGSAARRCFGSWQKAVETCGVRYTDVLKAHRRPRETIIHDLRQWVRENGPLNATALGATSGGLLSATVRMFGSVAAAAKKLGLPYFVLSPKWSKDLICQNIRRRFRKGLTLRPRFIAHEERNLYNAGRKYFGTWTRAVTASGIDYAKVVPLARRR